jgi:hypothetical protein
MSVPSINCPKCGSPMPANYAWCPNCGHTNAFVAPDSTVTPPDPRPSTETDAVAETTDEVAASASGPEMSGAAPEGGTPTVNVGTAGEGEAARYTPPPDPSAAGAAGAAGAAAAWQPGQYNNAPIQSMQPQPPQGQYTSPQQYAPPAPMYGQPEQTYPYSANPPKDPTVALLLELIGYAGFLGIGHIYAGKTNRGVTLLVGGILYLIVSSVLVILLVGFCLLAAWLVVPIASGLWIKSELEKENAMRRV